MSDLNDYLFQLCNGLAGHSWWVDSVVGLTMANDLIKAAIIGGCFFAAWYSGATQEASLIARRKLLITLAASVLTLATSTILSQWVVQPRPYLQVHKIYQLSANQLEETPRLTFRQPLDNRAKERERAFNEGNIPPGDLGAFPSDHAGFFVCLSLGIFLASRPAGVVALTWTAVVIVFVRVMTGMHMPLEIAFSCLIAMSWLGACYYVGGQLLGTAGDRILLWTSQHASLTAATLFVALFEVASTLDHVKALLAAIGKHI